MEIAPSLCPSCKAALPDTGQFPTWCPACDWNVEAEYSVVEWKLSTLDKLIERVRGRYAAKQYKDLVAREPHSLRPRWTIGKAATYILAAVVNALPLFLAAFSIWLIYTNWPSIVAIVWGAILLFTAWALLPSRNRMPKNLLDRSSAPLLYDLVDQVAAASGTRKVYTLVVDADFGASFQQVGLRRRSVVTLGLPLWSVLSPQERIALISHEFAHGTNRDSLTHGFIGRAINTLANLSSALAPSYDDLFAMILSPLLAIISGFFRWLAMLMIVLFWQRSQEAEFRADYSAARIGGSEAASSLLQKTGYSLYIRPVLDPLSYSNDWRGRSFLPAFKIFVANLPAIERERARRAFNQEKFSTHTTHPPHWARLRFLERHASAPSFLADSSGMSLIDQELEKLEPVVTGKLLALYYPDH